VLGPNQDTLPRMRFDYPPHSSGWLVAARGNDCFIHRPRINANVRPRRYDAAGIGKRDNRRPYSDADLVVVFLKPHG
jgi:hypothetical protein